MNEKTANLISSILGIITALLAVLLIVFHVFAVYDVNFAKFIYAVGYIQIATAFLFFLSLFINPDHQARLPVLLTFIISFILFVLLHQWFVSPVGTAVMLVVNIGILLIAFATLLILLIVEPAPEKLIPVSVIVACLFALYTIYPLNRCADVKSYLEAERLIGYLNQYEELEGRYPVHIMEVEDLGYRYRGFNLIGKPLELTWDLNEKGYTLEFVTRFDHTTNVYGNTVGDWKVR